MRCLSGCVVYAVFRLCNRVNGDGALSVLSLVSGAACLLVKCMFSYSGMHTHTHNPATDLEEVCVETIEGIGS